MRLKKNLLLINLVLFYQSAYIYANACKQSRFSNEEKVTAFRKRLLCARRQTLLRDNSKIKPGFNEEELNNLRFVGQFTKLLEHDPNTGLLTISGKKNYKKLVKALNSGQQNDFNNIERFVNSTRKFVNPQNAFTFSMQGCDSALFNIKAPPHLTSDWAAAEILELYLKVLCRDVSFHDYGTGLNTDADGNGGSLTNNAASVLQNLGNAYKGPKNSNNIVDSKVLFRGSSKGDKIGPYISQFLLASLYALFPVRDIPFIIGNNGINNLNSTIDEIKAHVPIAQKREFGVSWADFVAIQNGLIPKKYTINDFDQINRRYILNGRDLGTYSHVDTPYEAYYNVISILSYCGFPLSKALPYKDENISNEIPFGSMGIPDIFALIGGVMEEALKAAWAQKWRVYRKLRPEEMAGLIHRAKITGNNKFNLHKSIFDVHNGIDVLSLILQHNMLQVSHLIDPQKLLNVNDASTYLLAQMYPEASPIHSSYPSGHAVIAGACITVIKAIFEDTTLLKSNVFVPLIVNPIDPATLIPLQDGSELKMTIGSELDKLASNISFGRNFGGIHYRSDAEEGIKLGEEVAIAYLQDHGCCYTEQGFKYFEFTKRNGNRVRIRPNGIEIINK